MATKFTPEDLKKAEMLMKAGYGALTDEQLGSVVGGQLDTDAIIEELRVIGDGNPDVEAVIKKFLDNDLFGALMMADEIKAKNPELYNKCYDCIVSHF